MGNIVHNNIPNKIVLPQRLPNEQIRTEQTVSTPYDFGNSNFEGDVLEISERPKDRKQLAAQMRERVLETENRQGPVGKTWNKTKNFFHMNNGTRNVYQEIQDFEDGKLSEEEVLTRIQKYETGQAQVLDIVADIGSYTAAAACYASALGGAVASPFTGGASLGVSVAAIAGAAAAGAATKAAIKSTDAYFGNREYTLKEQAKDLGTGALNGPVAAATAGVGYGVTKLAGKFGVQTAAQTATVMEQQVVVGFGKATTRETVAELTNLAAKEGYITMAASQDAIKAAPLSEVRKAGEILLGNADNKTLQAATQLVGNFPKNPAGTLLIEGPTDSLAARIVYKIAKGAAEGGTFAGISSTGDYVADGLVNGEKLSLSTAAARFGIGVTFGSLLGGSISAAGEIISPIYRGIKGALPKAGSSAAPISVTGTTVSGEQALARTEAKGLIPTATVPKTAPVMAESTASIATSAVEKGVIAATAQNVTIPAKELPSITSEPKLEITPTGEKSLEKPSVNTENSAAKTNTSGIQPHSKALERRIEKLYRDWGEGNDDLYESDLDVFIKEIPNLDYSNLNTHLKNIRTCLTMTTNYRLAPLKKGYFASKEGAEAFDILRKEYSPGRMGANMVAPLSIVLSSFSPQEVLKAKERNLISELMNNAELVHKLLKMSDEEYAEYIQRVEKSIQESGKTYEELASELKSEAETILKEGSLERFEKSITRDNVTARLKMLKAIKESPREFEFWDLMTLLYDLDTTNIDSQMRMFEQLQSRFEISNSNFKRILNITSPQTEKTLTKIVDIADVPLSKILEVCEKFKGDFIEGKISEEAVLAEIDKNPLIKTIRAIGNTSEIGGATHPTELNPRDIKSSSLALVHMTNYEFTDDGLILSTRDKLGGSRNSVHFTLNHAVSSHRYGDWDDAKIAVIMPFDAAVEANAEGKFIEGMPNDLYTNGSVTIPEGSVIIKINPEIKKGEIKVSEHPTIKGVKVIETSEKPHDLVPSVLKRMGYSHLQADGEIGQFSYREGEGTEIASTIENYNAWAKFCKQNGIKPTMHSYSPGGYAESLIERIDLLSTLPSWKNGSKQELLNNIRTIKPWHKRGYFISYDLDTLYKIVRESATPEQALARLKKELGFHPTVHRTEFYTSISLMEKDNIFVKTMRALNFPKEMEKYLKEKDSL